MKHMIFVLCLTFASAFFPLHAEQWPSKKVLGILTVSNMTQGALFFMAGRVGEATYQFQSPQQQLCKLLVPVVVGSKAQTYIGVSEVAGFSLQVYSEKLHDALIAGQRILSREWLFSDDLMAVNMDGVVTQGIEQNEAFVLNSKRRWLSWITGNHERLICEKDR
ncbi:hypothetical protein [Marinomonas sp.]